MPLDDLGTISAITYLLTLWPGIYSGLSLSGSISMKLVSSLVARKRKILGISCFVLGLIHGLSEVYKSGGFTSINISDCWSGIAIVALWFPLVITPNKFSLQRLGKAGWQRLHYLTYVSLPLVGIHTYLKGKVLSAMHGLLVLAVVILVCMQLLRFFKNQKAAVNLSQVEQSQD
jgi:DMSO/TMAO reductase YedYZ heme-binding membrane subunit